MASGYEDALGGDPARLRIWIDDYPNSSVDGETYGRHKWVEEGVKAGYYLRHSMNRWRPLSMTAVIEWRRPSHETFFGDSVLVPPPGFEHLDMSVLD